MTSISLKAEFEKIPNDASEAVVDMFFPSLLFQALGFEQYETRPQFDTGDGPVDHAARKNLSNGDTFLANPSDPYVLLELKGRDINLCVDGANYKKTVKQLERYFHAPNCKTAQWGIITNSKHIQLFRRHGKVIHPATSCISLNSDNIDDVINLIREKIHIPRKALTIAIYNNKGGVGKTTTVVNLAATLSLLAKKVLVIDFDPNQQDLTNSLGLPLSNGKVYECLNSKPMNADVIEPIIEKFSIKSKSTGKEYGFDIIPADAKLIYEIDEIQLRQMFSVRRLSQLLENLRDTYDYILIDAPPNWRFFSQSAVYASDTVLIPTKHNNLFSLENAALAIKKFIPEVQENRQDGGPIALPIFFNGEKTTPAQLAAAQHEIDSIIKKVKKDEKFDLLPFFYSRFTNSRKNRHVFEVPSYAHIANAAFARIPAAYKDKSARDYYKALVKEYFL